MVVHLGDDGAFGSEANADDLSLDLTLKPAKPLVIHGQDGISQKAEGEGRASHYYSFTRLSSEGVLRIGEQQFAVSGLSWFDHEWATNQLAANQVGWDWFSLQLDDGSDLMLIQFRTKDGERDPNSAGTFVDAERRCDAALPRRTLRSSRLIRGQARKRAAAIR